tara:strand:- start:282 stop:698 length:417 start_codon:yes stop_codon:yes gene_type:complete
MKIQYNITEINPKTIKDIRQLISDSLAVVLEDNNLRMDFGNGSYDDTSVKFSGFRISLADSLTPQEKALESVIATHKYAEHLVTIDKSKIGVDRGQQFKLVGFKTRARKRPFVIQDVKTGKKFVTTEQSVERMFGVAK